MAGPVCSVLIAQAQGVPELIEELIDLVSEPHDHGWMAQLKEESRDRHFAVMHTTSIGGSYIGDGEPYMLCVEPFSVERDSLESSAADNANMAQTIGWVPQCQVDVIAFCSGDHNHRIVAELALWLAERTAGVIDLGDEVPEVHALREWAVLAPVDMGDGEVAHTTVAGPATLRVWMAHPKFHMVK